MTFPGFKNIGDELFKQSKFKYHISGDELVLHTDNFKQAFDFEITKDSLLKIAINNDTYENIYFEYQTLNLSGKYRISSYTINKTFPRENVKDHHSSIDSPVAFDFNDDKTVIINPKLFQYFAKTSSSIDSVFKYQVNDDKIVFSNSEQTFELPYTYDGILHLHLNGEVFEKFDLGKMD